MLDGLAEQCTQALAEYGCPSVSVAVAEQGEVVLAEAYGQADTATGRPATPGTVYGLASVTKPITATAVCLAADQGLLDLDAPPAGDHRKNPPTLRQLLCHRGGLGAHYDFHYGGGDRPIDATRYEVQYREPGTGFEYANLGYALLGRELEAVTGQDLGGFVRERVFEPLGLTRCRLGPRYPGPAPSAVRYTVDGRVCPPCDTSHPGASLGWATAGELALFAQTYHRLLKPGTAAAVLRAEPLNARLGYGLGWCVSHGGGPVVQSHGGGMGGVAAMVAAVPAQQLSVAVLTNSTRKAARDAVFHRIMAELVPGYRAELVDPAVPDPERPLELPAGSWAGTVGTPEGELPVTLRLAADGRVELRLAGRGATAPATASAAWDLRAAFALQLPTADARINSPLLSVALRREAGGLTGVACAWKAGDGDGLLGNYLSHPCRFTPC
ncbi:serine hydrolase domain-containing protein [Streptacidiphilus griseoplanus]|uniref:serine hydrolase domain-containing protein n=1 Tax=Peterkaempfera griseoplana TaxID=66896 RepID=UPI0006E32960|nr:serine hydrolase domain-containing protein [Peterkaempfera griseoplana]